MIGIVGCPLDDPKAETGSQEPPPPPPPPVRTGVQMSGNPTGTATGEGDGFASTPAQDWIDEHGETPGEKIKVTVTVTDGWIEEVIIPNGDESPDFGWKVIANAKSVIWAKNTFDLTQADIDVTSTSTYTSKGIIEAGKNALNQILFPSVSLSKDILVMAPGGTETLDAIVSTGGTVTWSSNKSSVATVDVSTGVVTAVSEGFALITATHVRDGGDNITAQCLVAVVIPD